MATRYRSSLVFVFAADRSLSSSTVMKKSVNDAISMVMMMPISLKRKILDVGSSFTIDHPSFLNGLWRYMYDFP